MAFLFRTKLSRDVDRSWHHNKSHLDIVEAMSGHMEDNLTVTRDLNDPSISFSPSIKFIDASSSYELVSDNEESEEKKVDSSNIFPLVKTNEEMEVIAGEVKNDEVNEVVLEKVEVTNESVDKEVDFRWV